MNPRWELFPPPRLNNFEIFKTHGFKLYFDRKFATFLPQILLALPPLPNIKYQPHMKLLPIPLVARVIH